MEFMNSNEVFEDSSISDMIAFAESYSDAVTREYEISQEEASLLLLESAIDTDTYLYMVQENSRIFCEKMEKKATTLSEKMKKSMENFKKKIFGKSGADAQKSKMDKFTKFLKMNPDVANKKVTIVDHKKRLDDVHKQKKGLLTLAAKQKASGKYDKEPIIKYGKKWEEYKQHQKQEEFKKDVTVIVASAIGFDILNRAINWLNNKNATLENEYQQIINPPSDLSDNLKALYCSMSDAVCSQWNSLNVEEQKIMLQSQQDLYSLYSQFAPEFEQKGIDYQQVFTNNAQANGWFN